MQEITTNFTNVMSWLVLGFASVAVILLGLEAWYHQQDRQCALPVFISMVLVLLATATGLILLAAHSSQHGPLFSQLLLPLVAPLLLISFSRLSFSSSYLFASSPNLSRPQRLLLLVLCGGAILGTSGLVIFDLLA